MDEKNQDINYALMDNEYLTDTVNNQPEETHVDETNQVPGVTEQPPVENSKTTDGFEIDGLGNVTAEQIKEWKQGYMRQSDYTRKTQEIARMRKELETSQPPQSTPSYDQSTPGFVQQIMQRMDTMEQEYADRQVEQTVNMLKQKYPDFDEVKVLNTALEKGITDLEMVYKSMRDVDEKSLREQIRQEVIAELSKTRNATQTFVGTEPQTKTTTVKLSPQELHIAQSLGLSPEEYAKWK